MPRREDQEIEEANICADSCQCPVVMALSGRSLGVTGSQPHKIIGRQIEKGRGRAADGLKPEDR